jgi:prepilin peptidase CpaA
LPPPASDPIGIAVVTAAALAGAVIDARTGRLPNALTFSVAAAGLVMATTGTRPVTPALAVAGALVGLILLLPGYMFGGTGAGDLKFLAAFGTWLGPRHVMVAFVVSAIAGGVLAIMHARRRGRVGVTLRRTAGLLAASGGMKHEIDASAADTRFAYGPAIALGAVAAVFWP